MSRRRSFELRESRGGLRRGRSRFLAAIVSLSRVVFEKGEGVSSIEGGEGKNKESGTVRDFDERECNVR